MAKVWKPGDNISYEELNKLQEKADAYDKLMSDKREAVKPKGGQGSKGVDA